MPRSAGDNIQPGWVAGQAAIAVGALDARVIIGTWQTRAEWEAWHADPKFRETRRQMEGLEARSWPTCAPPDA